MSLNNIKKDCEVVKDFYRYRAHFCVILKKLFFAAVCAILARFATAAAKKRVSCCMAETYERVEPARLFHLPNSVSRFQ